MVQPLQPGRKLELEVELRLVRERLRLSVAETALLFGVKRPKIYSWQNGDAPQAEKAERLHEIAQALEPHLPILQTQSGRLAHRAIAGRNTLLDLLAQGSPAQQVVDQLAELLAQEAVRRERLALRLQGRYGCRGTADVDTFS